MRRPSRRTVLRVGAPAAIALVAGAAIGHAAIPAADGTISACFNPTSTPPGQVRIIDADTQQCLAGETLITWNQQGPPGPAGPQGPQGDPGFSGGGTSTDTTTTTTPDTFPTPTQAGGPSADIFLKLDGIPGESTDDKHKGEIDVTTFAFAVGRAAPAAVGTGGTSGSGGGTSGSGTSGSGGSGTGTGTGTGTGSGTGTGTGTAAQAGPATRGQLLTLRVDKNVDAASPLLLRAATTGQHIKSATITFRRSGDPDDREFLTYSLSDVQVTGYDEGGTDGDARDLGALEEQVDLTAAKIKATEHTTTTNGDPGPTITGTWQRRG